MSSVANENLRDEFGNSTLELGEVAKNENLGRKKDVAAYMKFEGTGLGGT